MPTRRINHPMRNFVESCLGGDPLLPEMHIGRRVRVQPGDMLLVCTDGFWSYLLRRRHRRLAVLRRRRCRLPCRPSANSPCRRGGAAADNTSVAVLRVL